MLTVTLKESDKRIREKITVALANEVNKMFTKFLPIIQKEMKRITGLALKTSPTYIEIVSGGDLAGHIGFPAGQFVDYMEVVVDAVVNSLYVEMLPAKANGDRISGFVRLSLLKSSMEEVLLVDAYKPITTLDGQMLPWNEWMLTMGNKIIIRDYDVHFASSMGRSNLAIMVKGSSSVWRMPTQHAGTKYDNWITRVLGSTSYADELKTVIRDSIKRSM